MAWDSFVGLVVFAFVTSVTPGPNNMMLLASGVNFGLKRTWPHIFGIAFGVSTLLLAMALGLGALFVLFPPLKFIGAAYMVWLAWKIATSGGPSEGSGKSRPMTFLEGVAFQWVNPKAWVMALGAVSGYFNADKPFLSGAVLLVTFWLTGVFSIIPWAAFGQAMQRFLADATRLKWFNYAMGGGLIASLWPMLK
jgi:threonine/homoserine/homoserine lactone efflux protein